MTIKKITKFLKRTQKKTKDFPVDHPYREEEDG